MIKLGNRMKVFPLPATTEALKEQFIPQVKARCEGLGLDLVYGVKFIEHRSEVDLMLYHLTITPVSISQDPTLTEIAALCKALEPFTCSDEAPFAFGGRDWRLGDGDDTLATFMNDGRFCIWLRGWVKDE